MKFIESKLCELWWFKVRLLKKYILNISDITQEQINFLSKMYFINNYDFIIKGGEELRVERYWDVKNVSS